MASSAGARPATRADQNGGRAWTPGPRRHARALAALAVLAVLGAALLASLGPSSAAPGARARAVAASSTVEPHIEHARRYGGLPSWLPRPNVPVDRTLRASAGHPALAIEGEAVAVTLPAGRLLVTAVGPSVPASGLTPPPASTPCTFVVTLARASAPLKIEGAAFSIVDELGHVHQPRVTSLRGAAAPRLLARGATVTLALHSVLATGNGTLRWQPRGAGPLAAWDFAVEID